MKYTLQRVNPQIVGLAVTIAKGIVADFNLGTLEEEEIVTLLVDEGVRLERDFQPGECPLAAYLARMMKRRGLNVRRDMNADKRAVLRNRYIPSIKKDGTEQTLDEIISKKSWSDAGRHLLRMDIEAVRKTLTAEEEVLLRCITWIRDSLVQRPSISAPVPSGELSSRNSSSPSGGRFSRTAAAMASTFSRSL